MAMFRLIKKPGTALPARSPLEAADAARDRREWARAAAFYREAAGREPERGDLLIQLGNCLKEAGEHARAHAAYRRAATLGETADGALQSGHLCKITGNFAAARQHYRRARQLGSLDAAEELVAMAELQPEAMSGLREAVPGADGTDLALLRALAWCEHDFTRIERQRAAAHALHARGWQDLARAMFALAALRAGFGPAERRMQTQIALQTGLWEDAAPSAPTVDVATDPIGAAVRLLRADADFVAPDATFLPGYAAGLGEAGERVATMASEAHCGPTLAAIVDLAGALAQPATPALHARIAALWESLADTPVVVSFGRTTADARLTAQRVLSNGLRDFQRAYAPLAQAPFGSPGLLHGAARLSEAEGGAYCGAIAASIPTPARLLPALMQAAGTVDGRRDPAVYEQSLERLAVLLGQGLPLEFLCLLIAQLLEQHLFRAALVLIDVALGRGAAAEAILPPAVQALGDAGLAEAAVAVQRRLAVGEDSAALLELGIREKIVGAFAAATEAFQRVLVLDPAHSEARQELLAVACEIATPAEVAARWPGDASAQAMLRGGLRYRLHLEPWRFAEATLPLAGSRLHELAPEAAPGMAPTRGATGEERLDIVQLGWERRQTQHGEVPLLRGVEAVRVRCVSAAPLGAMRLRMDGRTLCRLPAAAPGAGREVVFNAWIDTAGLTPGFHELECYVEAIDGSHRSSAELVLIDTPREAAAAHAGSDAAVVLDDAAPGQSLEARINAAPSVVRRAERQLFDPPLAQVLVVRADQLGDFVASVPAMLRMRALLPEAALTALVSPGNVALAQSLGVFARVLTTELTFDHAAKRRLLPLAQQAALRAQLVPLRFDLAIDLNPGSDSRFLLRLAGARHAVGFKPHEFRWLRFGIDAVSRDVINGRNCMPHAVEVLSLVEAFGAALHHQPVRLAAPGASRAALARYGIGPEDGFFLLHTGARLAFSRWSMHQFTTLAAMLLEATHYKIVMLSDDPSDLERFSTAGLPEDRASLTIGKIASEDLEALIAHCAVFVGNDTGPKHLAALRGAKVVSVHMARMHWAEWGQEGHGCIVSRRVPCAGCGIEEASACGQDMACLTHIRPHEVCEAVLGLLAS